MATFHTFEEVGAWQEARMLVNLLYRQTQQGALIKDFGLRDQLQRAGVSILSHIAEGFERNSTKEFIQFLTITKGSVGEVRAHLYVAHDRQYIDQADFEQLSALAIEIGRMLGSLISYLNITPIKGLRHKKP